MVGIISRVNVGRTDLERLSEVEDIDIPTDYELRLRSDPQNCPLAFEGSCEGVKDREYLGRCFSDDFDYKDCKIYQLVNNSHNGR